MKAVVYREYGSPDVLKLEEVARPVPAEGEVLVEVHAASVNFANPALVRGKPFLVRLMAGGLLKPRYNIPGGDIAGRVETVGKSVKEFQPGDEVYGDLAACGFGAYAEYVSAPANMLAPKPANLTFDEAAAAPQSALVALQGLRKGRIEPGQKVLIYGASGGNGTFAVQIAKSFGAEVTAVCSNRNLDMVRSIGADKVIDYTREDFAKSGQRYDLILATAGYRSIFDYKRALNPGGIYVMAGGAMSQVFQAMMGPLVSVGGNKTLTNLYHRPDRNDLLFMKELIEAGKVKPVIDRRYSLSEVADAFRYYETGRSRGKIVITIK
jgi:NADPH:quinone reductase-like Zn-dependent oxidoreductase